MADLEKRVVISAQDDASAKVQQVAEAFTGLQNSLTVVQNALQGFAGAGDAVDSAAQKSSSALKDVGNSAAGAGSSLGDFLTKSLEVATGFTIAGAVTQAASALREFAVGTIDAGAQMQIIQTKAEVLFGSDFPQMSTAIANMANEFHRSQEEIGGFVTQSAMFTESMGASREQAEQMGTGMADLAVKIGEATGTSEQEGFAMLERGLRGFGRALIDVGVDLDQHILQQYMDDQGIQQKYTSLTDLSKAQVAYAYLLEHQSTIDEMAAKNAGSYDEKLKELGADFQTLEGTLGKMTVGPATAVLGGLDDIVVNLDSNIQRLSKDFSAMNIFNLWAGVDQAGGDFVQPPSGAQTQDEFLANTLQLNDAQIASFHANEQLKAGLQQMPSVGGAASNTVNELKTAMDGLSSKYDEATQKIDESLTQLDDSHKQKMASLTDDIDTVKKAMTDLDTKYAETVANINGQTFDKVGDQFQKVAGLAEKVTEDLAKPGAMNTEQITSVIQNLSPEGKDLGKVTQTDINAFNLSKDMQDQVNAVIQLNREEESLATWLEKNAKLSDQQKQSLQVGSTGFVDAAKGILQANPNLSPGLATAQGTDFDKFIADQNKKATDAKTQHDKEMAQDNDKIAKDKEKMAVEDAAYGAQRTSIINAQIAMAAWHGEYIAALNDMDDVTKQKIKDLTDSLSTFTQTLSGAQATILAGERVSQGSGTRTVPGRATGGYVNEPLTLVGEHGPELVSLPTGSYVHTAGDTQQMMGGQGGLTIQGPLVGTIHVHNEADEDRLIAKFQDALTRKVQLQGQGVN